MTTGTRIRNVVFCAVCIVIFCAAVLYKAADMTDTLPEELDNGKQSYLEGAALQPLPEFSLAAFASGDLQDEIEDYLSGCWPARDEALLANAAWQRSVIVLAAATMNYNIYPTFFGSNVLYDENLDLLTYSLSKKTPEHEQAYENAASQLNSFADSYPDIDTAFYCVDRLYSSNNNPARPYISNPIDSDFLSDHFYNLLNDRFAVIDGTLESTEESSRLYFRSDHHWNNPVAYDAYKRILDSFMPGENPIEDYQILEWKDVPFYGAVSRSALCTTKEPDYLIDYWIDLPSLTVVVNGKEQSIDSIDHREQYASGEYSNEQFANRYGEYYHGDYSLIELNNPSATTNETLLIVADSFSNNMERFFSYNFETVYSFDPRKAKSDLSDFINTHNVDKILFLFSSQQLINTDFMKVLQ